MGNLRVAVDNAADQTEARNIMISLGYLPKEITCISGGDLGFVVNAHNENGATYKEITLPELRDLVVLKRNDVGDATHVDQYGDKWIFVSGIWYFYSGKNKWDQTLANLMSRYELKPIEKKEMKAKEYLNKETYAYVKTHDLVSKDSNWIEIPEWAVAYADHKNGHGFFYDSFCKIASFYNIVWSRHTLPEELPFIDDECYTNKSDGGFRLPKVEPCDMSKWVEHRGESLDDQYAEIEKVRQSHRTASEIADSALKHIRERAETYDQPTGERSAAKTAKAFNAITGKDITESEVWLLLQLLKDVRQWSREDYHQDSAEDCIAYAALKAESLESGE